MNTKEEQAYSQGSRAAWLTLFQTALGHLGYLTKDMKIQQAKWILEREQTIQRLRIVCGDYGDNDWSNDLHLADVIEKHLATYFGERIEELETLLEESRYSSHGDDA